MVKVLSVTIYSEIKERSISVSRRFVVLLHFKLYGLLLCGASVGQGNHHENMPI